MNPITKLRKEQNYSQTDLAARLGVSQSAVSQWELGKTLPDILTASKLAILFGVAIEDLLDNPSYGSMLSVTKIRVNFGKLNTEGQRKLLEYSEDLLLIDRYKKKPIAPEEEVTSNGND